MLRLSPTRPPPPPPQGATGVKGRRSPGAALAAVAADGVTVAVALLDDHADVGLHQLGDVHDLQARKRRSRYASSARLCR